MISPPWPRWAWPDIAWRWRTALTSTPAHSFRPAAVTTATSSRPSVGEASGNASTPPFSVPMLPTSTQLAGPSKNVAPSMATCASNVSRARALRTPARR